MLNSKLKELLPKVQIHHREKLNWIVDKLETQDNFRQNGSTP